MQVLPATPNQIKFLRYQHYSEAKNILKTFYNPEIKGPFCAMLCLQNPRLSFLSSFYSKVLLWFGCGPKVSQGLYCD